MRELTDLELAAHHYNHLAVAAFLNGKLEDALVAIDEALRLTPESASFLNNRATVLAGIGEPALALAEAAHAAELAPEVPLYRYQLGRLYLGLGDIQSAIVTLSQAMALRPRYSLARRDLGWAYLLDGNIPQAERELRLAAGEDPGTPDVDLYLGLFLVSQGRQGEARAVAEAGLKRQPGETSLSTLLDLLSPGSHRNAAGVERLQKALESVRAARPRVRVGDGP
jgi:Flp pilus assembly protein TadD